jgi:glycosidase
VPPRAELSLGPAWTRGAVCYEIFVRSFYDSNGDGIGDLRGLTEKLDYINDGDSASARDLGASCVWLMPVAESPSYHGYDVKDYYHVNPDYGTADDFLKFVAEAHRRGIKVLVDMVLNHSSSEHPDFQAALRDTASPYRKWYRFSPEPLGKGPWGAEAWRRSPVGDEYYYGVFSSEMPDLDYHTPEVREEAKRIAEYWLREMGVDGFRLDAVPYLVEDGDCQMGCAGTHEFLREYAAYIRGVAPDAYTVGEVWGDVESLMPYYPDQLTSYFGFELADSLVAVVNDGNAAGLLPGYLRLQKAEPYYRWSPILSNHDGTRSMTRFGGDVARAKLGATLLLTLPGLPFVYYGEEIGMTGDKPDPRLRTPMQWAAKSGVGFTSGTPWESPQPDSLEVNVAEQDADPRSLLNLYRRLIHLRKTNDALATGELVPLSASDPHVAAFLRRTSDHAVLVVANLGGAAVAGVTVRSDSGTLEAGDYTAVGLLDAADGAELRVGAGGRIEGYAPVSRPLSPRESLVLELKRRQ